MLPADAPGRLRLAAFLPGLGAVLTVTVAAFGLTAVTRQASPLAWAIFVGVAVGPMVRRAPSARAGTEFASRHLLRAGIALIGFSVSLTDVASIGLYGLILAAATVASTLVITKHVAGHLQVDRELGFLVAVGTAICGASAIAGVSAVIKAKDEAVAFAIATVTVYGILAMFLLPPIGLRVLGMSPTEVGLWAGASIHEVAQVTVAGTAVSAGALQTATLIKLTRVLMLIPLILALRSTRLGSRGVRRASDQERVPLLPGFVLAFLGFVVLQTVLPLPSESADLIAATSAFFLTAALASIGLQVRVGTARKAGARPLVLGLASTFVVAATSLIIILLSRVGAA